MMDERKKRLRGRERERERKGKRVEGENDEDDGRNGSQGMYISVLCKGHDDIIINCSELPTSSYDEEGTEQATIYQLIQLPL